MKLTVKFSDPRQGQLFRRAVARDGWGIISARKVREIGQERFYLTLDAPSRGHLAYRLSAWEVRRKRFTEYQIMPD